MTNLAPGGLPFESAGLPLASIGRRVGAVAIDLSIGFVISFSIVNLIVTTATAAGRAGDAEGYQALVAAVYPVALLVALGWWLLLSWLQTKQGSPGQRALGVRLRKVATGVPLSLGAAFGRNLLFGLLTSIIVGYFTPLFDPRLRQGWHDKSVGAVMIDVRSAATAVAIRPTGGSVDAPAAAEPPLLETTPAGTPPATPFAPSVLAGSGVLSNVPFEASAPPIEPASAPVLDAATVVSVPGFERAAPSAAPPARPSGVLSEVPGVTRPHADDGQTISTVPPVGHVAAIVSVPSHAPDDDVEDFTRKVPPKAAAGGPALVVWDDGTQTAIAGPTVFGRNPDPAEHYTVVAVVDDTRSLSKTHFELAPDGGGLWLTDRHSTNGTEIETPGSPRRTAVPGEKTEVRIGDTIVIGERSFSVRGAM